MHFDICSTLKYAPISISVIIRTVIFTPRLSEIINPSEEGGEGKERDRERERDLRATDYGLLVAWRVLSWNQSTGHRFIFRSGYYFDRYTRVYIFEVRLLFFLFFPRANMKSKYENIWYTEVFNFARIFYYLYIQHVLNSSKIERLAWEVLDDILFFSF